jgi:hypothetical protein
MSTKGNRIGNCKAKQDLSPKTLLARKQKPRAIKRIRTAARLCP